MRQSLIAGSYSLPADSPDLAPVEELHRAAAAALELRAARLVDVREPVEPGGVVSDEISSVVYAGLVYPRVPSVRLLKDKARMRGLLNWVGLSPVPQPSSPGRQGLAASAPSTATR